MQFKEFLARAPWRPLRVAAINLLVFLLVCEAAIYLFPTAIPPEIIARFPSPQRGYFAKKHRLNTATMYRGDQYLYSLNATTALSQKSFPIDENGYRNAAVPASGSGLDVVFLGDSLMIAESADKDLGQLARDDGFSAYNLGMGGYGPLHYALAYEKYVVGPGLAPRNVVITLCTANDLKDLEESLDIYYKKNLTYYEYLNKHLIPEKKRYKLLTPIVLKGLWRKLTAEAKGQPQAMEDVAFTTPVGSDKLPHLRLATMGIEYLKYLDESLGDQLAECLNRIIAQANAAGARCLVVIMPNWDGLYGTYVTGYDEAKARIGTDYARLRAFLDARLTGDRLVYDARPALAAAAAKAKVTDSLRDYHLNTHGVQVLYQALRPMLNLGPADR